MPRLRVLLLALVLPGCGGGGDTGGAAPETLVDLLTAAVLRVHGSVGLGALGVPVATGHDCDGDGAMDFGLAAMRASPLGRTGAGEVFLVFGDGSLDGVRDTAGVQPRVLRVLGDETLEACGNEIWIEDVTGDGIGDLLVGRQNHAAGAGALTIVVGDPALATMAQNDEALDLRAPPPGLVLRTLVGTQQYGRFGIWMRTGDVDGDGVADIVVGADQEDGGQGAAYVVRGGPHLAAGDPLDGHLARISVPAGSVEFHFGATCQIADLDGNGRGEVLVAATIERGGASIPPAGAPPGTARPLGGADRGRLYIAWDDNFAGVWPPGFAFDVEQSPGARTIIRGGPRNVRFGEEILGGRDYDGDGRADLFVGDITGDETGERSRAGAGYVFWDAAVLKDLDFGMATPPPGVAITRILGAQTRDIAADTGAHGDFDGDGTDDLAVASPHASPPGRLDAGTVHVFFGVAGGWPAAIDLRDPGDVAYALVHGARGTSGDDRGDILGYSADAADVDGDGRTDLVLNEMLGNGLAPGTLDVGNLVAVDGRLLR